MSDFSSRTRRTAIAVCTIAALSLMGGGTANAEVTLKLGWNTSDGVTDPYAIIARQFSEGLEMLAPDDFKVDLFPNRQIGDDKELLEGLSFGTVDVAIVTNAVIANVEAGFQLNDLPFLYESEEQAHRILDGPVGQELLHRLLNKGVIGLALAEGGFRNMINNVRPVTQPNDVEGVKYRVMQNPVFVEMFSSLGGNAVPMAWSEVFTAVQQGAVDGLEIPVAVVANNKYYEVTKYLSLTKHTYSAIGLLMSKKTYDKLTNEQQVAVWQAARMAVTKQRQMNAENNEKVLSQLEEMGMKINTVADTAAFRAKVKPVYDRFRELIGADLMDRALKAVEE